MNIFHIFRRKKVKTICLIQKYRLEGDNYKASYYTEVDGSFVWNSYSTDQKEAESFFNKVVAKYGIHEIVKVLKKETV